MFVYLSFALPGKHLGAVILEAATTEEAYYKTHLLQLNPGGECVFQEWPRGIAIPEQYIGKLLSKQDLDELGREITKNLRGIQ